MKTFLLMIASVSVAFANSADRGMKEITASSIKAHLTYLADDLLEGRAPGTRGGELAAKYIATQFEALGLKPGAGRSYYQNVEMAGWTIEPGTRLKLEKDGKTLTFDKSADFVAWTQLEQDRVKADGELVFAGYGINSDEFAWNDFSGADLKGKIILVLVNDPPSDDPKFFEGKAMTYYGRWIYKLEEARRQGALGALIVHNEKTASYPWSVVENSASGEHYALALEPGSREPLRLAGWVSTPAAEKIAEFAGFKWSELATRAAARGFKALPLGVHISTEIKANFRKINSPNVVAIKRGTDSKLRDTFVIYCSHYDHLGIGKPDSSGDSIYNGAVDNASGVAAMIALAQAFAKTPTRRSILFLIPTGEEAGLLGSEYYVKHPLVVADKTVAAINLDEVNVFGKTRDIFALGKIRSTMESTIGTVAQAMGLKVAGELAPERGTYFRSDHWSFARMAIPSTSIEFGREFVGPEANGNFERWKDFSSKRYHQPSDGIMSYWDYTAAVQHTEFAFRLGFALAEAPQQPKWRVGHEVPKAARFDE